jgi:hypothetical protein
MALVGVLACTTSRAARAVDAHALAPSLDSIVGIVRVTGVAALPQATLTLDDGSPSLRLVGSPLLAHVVGVRVAVIGLRSPREFAVWRFVVVGANGIAASDGLLVAHGDTLLLVAEKGTHVVAAPSAGLRAAVGRRVWISGPLNAPTVAYGIIE